MEKCSIREAALKLQRWCALPAPRAYPVGSSAAKERKAERVREKEERNPPLRFALRGVDHGHPYLRQRGIDEATALEFGVGFYGRAGLLSGRIVIPIRNAAGEIVAYAGRAIDGRLPKYKLPSGFRKGLELFNVDRASATGSPTVIVVEGYFDCLRVHQAGFPWVVALMGSSLSHAQATVLVERFERVLLMLDGDATGHNATRVIHAQLSQRAFVVGIQMPDGVQPDQLSTALLQRLIGSHLAP
jgi:DNA primase